MIVAQYLAQSVTLRKHFDYKNGSISTKTTETRNENDFAGPYIYLYDWFRMVTSPLVKENQKQIRANVPAN